MVNFKHVCLRCFLRPCSRLTVHNPAAVHLWLRLPFIGRVDTRISMAAIGGSGRSRRQRKARISQSMWRYYLVADTDAVSLFKRMNAFFFSFFFWGGGGSCGKKSPLCSKSFKGNYVKSKTTTKNIQKHPPQQQQKHQHQPKTHTKTQQQQQNIKQQQQHRNKQNRKTQLQPTKTHT